MSVFGGLCGNIAGCFCLFVYKSKQIGCCFVVPDLSKQCFYRSGLRWMGPGGQRRAEGVAEEAVPF
jgi:hypothetical protein